VFYSIQKVGKPELVEKLLNWDMDGSINEFFQRECGVEITHTVTEILPIQSSKDIAGKMGVPEEVPILLMDQIQYERNNAPVCRSYDYYRTDVFRFNLIRKREGVLV
jgi:DNA-binding GntR family transcriptional regulator